MMGLVEIHIGLEPNSDAWKEEAQKAVKALETDGAISVYGHDIDDDVRRRLIYFVTHVFKASEDVQQRWVFADKFYQVGLTPPGVERHRFHQGWKKLPRSEWPLTNEDSFDDLKYRWFEPLGPAESLPFEPVNPGIAGFRERLCAWGKLLAYEIVKNRLAKMIAHGYGLPLNYFDTMLEQGVHLIAPTGAEISRKLVQLEEGRIPFIKLAGFHNDLNWGTIHGRASQPGLWIWTTSGAKKLVQIPEGHLLFQVGQQLAAQTAYRMEAGYHEVVITQELGRRIKASQEGQTFTWRIGSTVFVTLGQNTKLIPHERLLEGLNKKKLFKEHPHLGMSVKDQMTMELERISFA